MFSREKNTLAQYSCSLDTGVSDTRNRKFLHTAAAVAVVAAVRVIAVVVATAEVLVVVVGEGEGL